MRVKRYSEFMKSKIREIWANSEGLDPQIVEEVLDELLQNYILNNRPEIGVEVRRRMLVKERQSKLKSLLGD
jgi:hypothetical protein